MRNARAVERRMSHRTCVQQKILNVAGVRKKKKKKKGLKPPCVTARLESLVYRKSGLTETFEVWPKIGGKAYF